MGAMTTSANSEFGGTIRFLGYFQPQEGKPALWELDTDYYLHVTTAGDDLMSDSYHLRQVLVVIRFTCYDTVISVP